MQPILGTPREALAAADVERALGLSRGARVRHGLDVLTTGDVQTSEQLRLDGTGGSVTWSYRAPDRVVGQTADLAAVRRRATLPVDPTSTVPLSSRRLRVWTEWQLDATTWARFYLGVFVVTNPGGLVDDGVRLGRTLQVADKSYLWAQKYLADPLHLAAGTVVLDWIKGDLLSRFGEARYAFPTSTAALALAMAFETGTSLLDVYSRLLEAVAFDQLTANELGLPTTAPLSELAARPVEHVYGAGLGKVVPAGEVEPLLSTLPNVVRFSARQGPSLGNVEGNGQRTVVNQSTGPASIDARGGTGVGEVELRVDVDAASQAELDAVAVADAQRYFAGGGLRWRGTVAINPRHSDRDVVGLVLPRLGLAAGQVWQVTEWTYPLGDLSDPGSATMPLTAERRVP